MTGLIYVNGRFSTQSFSGVQRFAAELTFALQNLRGSELRVLVPLGAKQTDIPGAINVGRHKGQFWEQFELPRHSNDGLLLNLGNTAPLLSRRQIVVLHDTGVFSTPESYSWKLRLWYKTMQKLLVLRRTPIITVSHFARREIIKNLHANPADVMVVSEGTDHMGRIAADDRILEINGLEMGGFVLVVGNLAAHKNLFALTTLAQSLAKLRIKLVVTGRFGGEAFRAAQGPMLPEPALYIGRVNDGELKALYQAAACFVFPSRYEGFGLPVAEAMACGCPVVSADIPALRETFSDAVLYCDPFSPADIAAKVLQVLNIKALSSNLRARGLQMTEKMTWQKTAETVNTILSHYV